MTISPGQASLVRLKVDGALLLTSSLLKFLFVRRPMMSRVFESAFVLQYCFASLISLSVDEPLYFRQMYTFCCTRLVASSG